MAPNEFIGRDKEAAALRKAIPQRSLSSWPSTAGKASGKLLWSAIFLAIAWTLSSQRAAGSRRGCRDGGSRMRWILKPEAGEKCLLTGLPRLTVLKTIFPHSAGNALWFSSTGCPLWTRRKAFSSVPCHTSGTDGTVRVRSSSSMSADLTEHG